MSRGRGFSGVSVFAVLQCVQKNSVELRCRLKEEWI